MNEFAQLKQDKLKSESIFRHGTQITGHGMQSEGTNQRNTQKITAKYIKQTPLSIRPRNDFDLFLFFSSILFLSTHSLTRFRYFICIFGFSVVLVSCISYVSSSSLTASVSWLSSFLLYVFKLFMCLETTLQSLYFFAQSF